MGKRLYLDGHSHKLGYVVCLDGVDVPPVRFYQIHPNKVRAIIARFNRRYG